MDYSIYDAINAGFGKLVFVIRKDFEKDFRDKIISKYEGHIPVSYTHLDVYKRQQLRSPPCRSAVWTC